jgi:hypothetical protein
MPGVLFFVRRGGGKIDYNAGEPAAREGWGRAAGNWNDADDEQEIEDEAAHVVGFGGRGFGMGGEGDGADDSVGD